LRRLRKSIFLLALISPLMIALQGACQVSIGGMPQSSLFPVREDEKSRIVIQAPRTDILQKEDDEAPSPYRFGVTLPVDVAPGNSGTQTELPDGSHIWRVTIMAPGALAVSAYFDKFRIPPEGRLFLYNYDKTRILGAYTSINNSLSGYFATELLTGDQITLEYDQPAGQSEWPQLHLNEIAYAYRGVSGTVMGDQPEGTAGACEVNVNCQEGNDWQMQKKGVVRIQIKKTGSLYWCSGSLLNNVRQDKTPYILTANHCGMYATATDMLQWIFYFNYEYPSCENAQNPPSTRSLTGATMKAQGGNEADFGSDFFLVILNQGIPDSLDVVYNGWSRSDTASGSGVGIHHPEGDVKKISTYTTPLISAHWNSAPEFSHWKVYWAETPNGHGVTEGGSSGSPLFDSHRRITGALTGGDSNCDSIHLTAPDYYGKFYYSWDKNGTDSAHCLKYWLDPDNQNPSYIDGMEVKPPLPPSEPTAVMGPSPFDNFINILFTGSWASKFQLTFFDISGVIVLDRELERNSNQMEYKYTEVVNLPAGAYIVRLQTADRVVSKKMIKAAHVNTTP
jgi:hypothetical protein